MGSRVPRTLSLREPLSGCPRTPLAKVKPTTGALALFSRSRWPTFLAIEGEKGGSFDAASRGRLRASRSPGDPYGLEAFGGHRRPTGSGRERCPARLQLAGILHPSAALWHRSA